MYPLVEKKKEKSVLFSLTYKYYETAYTIFSTPSNPPIINNYYNVQPPPPPYYSNSLYCSGLKSYQEEFTIEKVINYMSNGKAMMIHLIVGLIKKI